MLLASDVDILSPLASVITVNVQPSNDWQKHCRLDDVRVTWDDVSR